MTACVRIAVLVISDQKRSDLSRRHLTYGGVSGGMWTALLSPTS